MDNAGRQPTRPEPLDADPSARLEEVFGLLDDLAGVTLLSEGLFSAIEEVTGLRVGEIQALRTIGHDPVDTGDIARRTGQADDAAAATVEGLIQRGLVDEGRGGGSASALRLTQSGAALLEQTQGVQVRLLDTLAGELGAEGVDAFRTTLRGVADMLRTVAGRAGIRQREASRVDRASDSM